MTETLSCGKIRYESKHAARKALARHRGSFATLRVYQCDGCHGWHLGHLTNQNGKGR